MTEGGSGNREVNDAFRKLFKKLVRVKKRAIIKKRKQQRKMERLYDPSFLTFGRDAKGVYIVPEQRPVYQRYRPGPGDYDIEKATKLLSTRSPEAKMTGSRNTTRRIKETPPPDAGMYQFNGSRYGRMNEAAYQGLYSTKFSPSPLKSNRMDFALKRDSPSPGTY